MPSECAFIVRNQAEICAAMSRMIPAPFFLCTNSVALDYCKMKGYAAMLLDEELIREEYKRLNAWGIRQTLCFIERAKVSESDHTLSETNFMYLSAFFVQVLMNVLVLGRIRQAHTIGELTIFDDDNRSLLQTTCREYQRLIDPSLRVNILPVATQKKSGTLSTRLKQVVAGPVNILAQLRYRRWLKEGKKIGVASGAFNHLG